jgi:Leucine-rich repeat (LRR) protein
VLRIQGSSITEVPYFIARLKSLKRLGLYYTEIKELPEFLAALPLLRDIGLEGTEIEKLPDSLKRFFAGEAIK